jgi:hypothetical protein
MSAILNLLGGPEGSAAMRRVTSLTNLIAVGGATTASPGGPQACEARPLQGKAIIQRVGWQPASVTVQRPDKPSWGSVRADRDGAPASLFSLKTPALLEQRQGVNHKPALPPECSPDTCHSSGSATSWKMVRHATPRLSCSPRQICK